MKQKINPSAYVELIALALLIVFNVWLLFNLGVLKELEPHPKPGLSTLVGGLTGSIFLVLCVHELGHLVVGLIQGFELTIFIVGPLGIKKEDGKTKVYLNTNLMLAGGIAGTAPVDDNPKNGDRLRRVVIAGPMMSLLFSAVCLSLAWRVGNSSTFPTGLFLLANGLLSIGIFFATTIPTRTGVSFSDRARYLRLLIPGKAQNVELATLRILGSYQQHDSYCHINKSDIEELITDDDPFTQFYGFYNLLCYQLELEQRIDPVVESKYIESGKGMSPAIVEAYNIEIEKSKNKFLS